MTVFGIASIVCTALSWDTHGENYKVAIIVALSTGFCCLTTAIIAYPLTYGGAQRYMKQQKSTGIKGLMITAWVFYGIMIVNGLAMIALRATGHAIVTEWVIYEVLWGIAGWIMMFVHAEKARKSPAQSVLPTTATTYKESTENPYNSWSPNTWYTVKTTFNKDGTETREIIKHSKSSDGNVTEDGTVENGGGRSVRLSMERSQLVNTKREFSACNVGGSMLV